MDEKLRFIADDSEDARQRIQELRNKAADLPALLSKVNVRGSRSKAIRRGIAVIAYVERIMSQLGLFMKDVEAGHGFGHFRRDFVNAIRLTAKIDLPPEQIFIGFVAGVLHEIGCTLVPRYLESGRMVRHAEASALLIRQVLDGTLVNDAELTLIMYAMTAHTHYLRPVEIKDADGQVVNVIQPYPDMVGDKPFYPVWLTRWADRLDCNGPAYVGRHYLTLLNAHHDFDGKNFYSTDFVSEMRPLIRTDEERGKDTRTMAEHLLLYANTQTNVSPYGKHDFGEMQILRDAYRCRLEAAVGELRREIIYTDDERRRIANAWTSFLSGNIEPSDRGLHAAEKLARMFERVSRESADPWLNVFRECLAQYLAWSASAMYDLMEIAREYEMQFARDTYMTILPAYEMP